MTCILSLKKAKFAYSYYRDEINSKGLDADSND